MEKKAKGKLIKGSMYVAVFLLLAWVFLANEAESSETYLEFGPSIVKGKHSDSFTLVMQERWLDKYAVSLGYISSQHINTCPSLTNRPDCVWDLQEQLFVGMDRIVKGNFDGWWRWANRISFSLGPYYMQNPNRVSSCNFLVRLGLDVALWDGWSIKAGHFSNAGSCKSITLDNVNAQVLNVGISKEDIKFDLEPLTIPVQVTGRFNVGQDMLLLTYRF